MIIPCEHEFAPTLQRALGCLPGGLPQMRRPWVRCEEGMRVSCKPSGTKSLEAFKNIFFQFISFPLLHEIKHKQFWVVLACPASLFYMSMQQPLT